ncbi:MAG TPA: carbohydrate kinase family protein [Propionicimonas sp.]|nr:carbohydrate kinase family protein [Propionicimonas sp.]
MTPHVFIAGPASWNTLVYLDRLPEGRPHMVVARGHTQTLGGTSAGKALNLASLGASVTLRTVVGTDPEAPSILQRLDRDGIEVIAETADGASEQHLNLMTAAGERLSIYLDVPELGTEQYAERTLAALDRCDTAVIDLAVHSRPLLAEARKRGKQVWCDIHDYNGTDRFHRDFIEAADVLFLNDDGLEDPVPFMRERVLAGTGTVVCTQGAAGATAVTAAGTVHVPAPPVTDIVDTNGAGDAFLAGFLTADQQGLDTERCMRAGHAQAALCLRVPDLAPTPATRRR